MDCAPSLIAVPRPYPLLQGWGDLPGSPGCRCSLQHRQPPAAALPRLLPDAALRVPAGTVPLPTIPLPCNPPSCCPPSCCPPSRCPLPCNPLLCNPLPCNPPSCCPLSCCPPPHCPATHCPATHRPAAHHPGRAAPRPRWWQGCNGGKVALACFRFQTTPNLLAGHMVSCPKKGN